MNKTNKADDKASIYSVIGGIAGTIGGISAMLLVVSYLILECYLNSINLDGVIQFSPDYLKIALIQFVIDGLNTNYITYIIVLYLLAYSIYYVLFRKRIIYGLKIFKNDDQRIKIFRIVITVLFLIIYSIVCIVAVKNSEHNLLIFGLLFPALLVLTEYIITRKNDDTYFIKPFVVIAVLLFFVIPVLYGRDIFDIDVYLVKDIDTKKGNESNLTENYYILDPRTSKDRELLISIGKSSKVILIDKNNIERLEIDALGNKLRAFQQEVLLEQKVEIKKSKDLVIQDTITNTEVDYWIASASGDLIEFDESSYIEVENIKNQVKISGVGIKEINTLDKNEEEKWMQ